MVKGGLAMKESLFDLFQRHRDCYDNRKSPTIEELKAQPEARQLETDRFRERKQAASEYASSLIPLGNDWIEAVKYDVKKLATTLPPSLHFNKAEREAYRDGVEDFLLDVAAALREHGKGKFLNDEYFDPVTLYRFGIGTGWEEPQTGLSKDEAKQIATEMKQRYSQVYCFPDLFSMFPATYTVMGYNAKASTPAQAQNKANNSTKGTGMGNNTTANPETPPATQETPKVAVLQPYTPNPVGRPTEDNFADTIADKYTIQGKADMIQEKLQRAISGMTEPMAIFALFVECFNKDILKQCPNHKQALSLIEDVAMREAYKRQWHNKQRNIYFDKDEAYLYLNETDSEQDNAINIYILQARPTVDKLLLLLEPPATKKKARKGA